MLKMLLPSVSQNHNTSDLPLPAPPSLLPKPSPLQPPPSPPSAFFPIPLQCRYTCCFWYEKYCSSLTYYKLVSVRISHSTWLLKMYVIQGWGEYYMGSLRGHSDKHKYTKPFVLMYYLSTDFPILILACSVLAPTLMVTNGKILLNLTTEIYLTVLCMIIISESIFFSFAGGRVWLHAAGVLAGRNGRRHGVLQLLCYAKTSCKYKEWINSLILGMWQWWGMSAGNHCWGHCSGIMMTSSNGNIFGVTGHLCGEFTGPRWIPRTKASDAERWYFLWSAPE